MYARCVHARGTLCTHLLGTPPTMCTLDLMCATVFGLRLVVITLAPSAVACISYCDILVNIPYQSSRDISRNISVIITVQLLQHIRRGLPQRHHPSPRRQHAWHKKALPAGAACCPTHCPMHCHCPIHWKCPRESQRCASLRPHVRIHSAGPARMRACISAYVRANACARAFVHVCKL